MDPGQPLNYTEGFGEFMSAMGWTSFEGQPFNALPMESPKLVQVGGTSNTAPSKQARKKVCVSRTKLPNFSPTEDMILVKCYLEVSGDAVLNTTQNTEKLRIRIMNQYNQNRENYPEWTMRSAQSRWDVIKLQVGKFCGYYAEVLRGNYSGMTDADKV
jgi:hypothetical protein